MALTTLILTHEAVLMMLLKYSNSQTDTLRGIHYLKKRYACNEK